MKTIANCTPKEFAAQTFKITNKIKNYADGIKRAKEEMAKENSGKVGIFEIISYICGDDVDETSTSARYCLERFGLVIH